VFRDIFVIEDKDGVLEVDDIDEDGKPIKRIDRVAAYKLFRSQFGDHYDFVFFHNDIASNVINEGDFSQIIHNMINGINAKVINPYKLDADEWDTRGTWSSAKIQSIQVVTNLNEVRRMLHETAHRWCAYVYHREGKADSDNLHQEFFNLSNPKSAMYHWGSWFDNDNSCMDYDKANWLDSREFPGQFEKQKLTEGEPGIDQFGYHALDLYLMGLISPDEVGSFRYIRTPFDPDGDGVYDGTAVNLSIANIIDRHGQRIPAYPNTQRVFHQAFILITKDLNSIGNLTSGVLGNFEKYRVGYLNAFRRATKGRAMIDGSLLHDNFEALFIRDNNADVGGASSSGSYWDSPDIWVRNKDDSGVDHQAPVRGQDNYVYARVHNSSSTNYENVTVRFYRANFAGTEFYYPEDWHPNQLIGEATITLPARGNAVAKVTWKANFIPDPSWQLCLLAEILPMQTIPENRHHVWENPKLAQKSISWTASYSIIDLGTLGGAVSQAFNINNSGQVVGSSPLTTDVYTRAFFWENGVMTNLITLNSSHSGAKGINNSAKVVGYVSILVPGRGEIPKAFLWQKGIASTLTLLEDFSFANSINDAGQIVGRSFSDNGINNACLWQGGVRTDLGTLGGRFSEALDINKSAQVVGFSRINDDTTRHAFVWENGVMKDLNTLIPANSGLVLIESHSINDVGQIVGYSRLNDINGPSRGFVWQNGVVTNLGTLGGDSSSARSINNFGKIVGNSTIDNTNSPTSLRPFLWENGVMKDLNTLIPANSGWFLDSAHSINENGQIVGQGIINGQNHAFLATPIAQRPNIESFTPSSGKAGTKVVIKGTNFTGASSVFFNKKTATFRVDSATQITATAPLGVTTGRISVQTLNGFATSALDFSIAGIIEPPPGPGPL
jgi:probable HAF family extracellular repeat protein